MPVCQAIYNCRLDEWRMFKNRTCLKIEHVQKQNVFLWLFETIIEEERFYLQV